MFDFNSWEFLALGVAAVLIFGPEKLPGMFRKAGEYYGQFQAIANGFRRELEAEVNAVADPIKETRHRVGLYVILFLLVLLALSVMLKREYWNDVVK